MSFVITTIVIAGCWNMPSLVEAEGLVTTASIKRGVSIDQYYFSIEKLCQFEMSITGVRETKMDREF